MGIPCKYNKLVRDFIPEIIERYGSRAVTMNVTDKDCLRSYLLKKLQEEVGEYLDSLDFNELVDVLQVIKDTSEMIYGIDYSELEMKRAQKEESRGGFKKGIVLLEVSDSETDVCP